MIHTYLDFWWTNQTEVAGVSWRKLLDENRYIPSTWLNGGCMYFIAIITIVLKINIFQGVIKCFFYSFCDISKTVYLCDQKLLIQKNFNPWRAGPSYLGLTMSMSWLLMPWLLRRQDIITHGIVYIEYVHSCPTWGRISTTRVMSMWRNDMKSKYMFLCVLEKCARNGLILSSDGLAALPPAHQKSGLEILVKLQLYLVGLVQQIHIKWSCCSFRMWPAFMLTLHTIHGKLPPRAHATEWHWQLTPKWKFHRG